MALDCSFDPKRGIRIHICSGTVDPDDILQALHEVYSDEGFSHSHHAIWDFRNCTVKISGDEMQKIINYVQRYRKGPGGGKVALVVSRSSDFGLARMYNLLSEYQVDRDLMVFRNYDDALKWIEEIHYE